MAKSWLQDGAAAGRPRIRRHGERTYRHGERSDAISPTVRGPQEIVRFAGDDPGESSWVMMEREPAPGVAPIGVTGVTTGTGAGDRIMNTSAIVTRKTFGTRKPLDARKTLVWIATGMLA
jgi:hypothetical protein